MTVRSESVSVRSTTSPTSTAALRTCGRSAAMAASAPSRLTVAGTGSAAGAPASATEDRPPAPDFLLQLHDPVDKRLGRGRAAGHVDIHRHDAVAAAHHRVGVMVVAAAIGAAAH